MIVVVAHVLVTRVGATTVQILQIDCPDFSPGGPHGSGNRDPFVTKAPPSLENPATLQFAYSPSLFMTDAEGNEIGKLFVGGLSQTTNNASLRVYFSQFGEIEDAVVMMDNKTGRSRGFGYVKYRDPGSVKTALDAKPHKLNGKEIDAKQCNINMKGRNHRSLKVFVGGISVEQDVSSITAFFEQFGRVTDVNLMMDSNKQRHRGFAFVGFDDESVVNRLINMHYITMNNKQVEIKAMEPPNFGRKSGSIMTSHHRQSDNISRAGGSSVSDVHNSDRLHASSGMHSCHQSFHNTHMACSPCVDPGAYASPPHSLMANHAFSNQPPQSYMGAFPTEAGYGGRLLGDQYSSAGYAAPGKIPTVPLIFANSFFPITPTMYGAGCQHLGPPTAYPAAYPILQPKMMHPGLMPGSGGGGGVADDYWSHGATPSTTNSASQTTATTATGPPTTRNHSLFVGSSQKTHRSSPQHAIAECEAVSPTLAGESNSYFSPLDPAQGIWCLPPQMQYPKTWISGPNEQHTMGGLLQHHIERSEEENKQPSESIMAKPSGDNFDREDIGFGVSMKPEESGEMMDHVGKEQSHMPSSSNWLLQRPATWAFRPPCWGDVHGFGLPPGIILQPHATPWGTPATFDPSIDHAVAAAMTGGYGYGFTGMQPSQPQQTSDGSTPSSFPSGGPSGIPELSDGPSFHHLEQHQPSPFHSHHRSSAFAGGGQLRHRRREVSPELPASTSTSSAVGRRWAIPQTTTSTNGKKTSVDKDATTNSTGGMSLLTVKPQTNEKSSVVAAGDHHQHHHHHRSFRM